MQASETVAGPDLTKALTKINLKITVKIDLNVVKRSRRLSGIMRKMISSISKASPTAESKLSASVAKRLYRTCKLKGGYLHWAMTYFRWITH